MSIIPKSQALFVGHQKIESNVLEQINNGRPHHAYVLAGPSGVGKATFAFRVAKYILSGANDQSSMDVDHNLPVISRIISGGHGDLCYIEPDATKETSIIGIDQIRQVSKFFSQKSMEGGYRIAIIDGQLNRNSANALLKILEEPPEKAMIFLITDSFGKLLPTIRSRCQALKFSHLSLDETKTVLNSLQLDKDISAVALASNGSPGKALWLMEFGGIETYSQFLATISAAKDDNLQKINDFCLAHSSKSGESGNTFIAIGQMFLDLIYRYTNGEVNDSDVTLFNAMSKTGSLSEWADTWHEINQLFKQAIDSHLDKYQILVTCFTKFSPKYKSN